MTQKTRDILWYVGMGIILSFLIVEFVKALAGMVMHPRQYLAFAVGVGAYFLIRLIPAYRKNEDFFGVFTHEFAHTIASLLCFQEIHSFEAKEKSGLIWHSGTFRFGRTFITLAPYCFPVYTLFLLLFRIIGASKLLFIFDFLIGITVGFYGQCYYEQTRPYQTDLKNIGIPKSYLFIGAMLLFIVTIILLSIRLGTLNGIAFLFKSYWQDIVWLFKFVF